MNRASAAAILGLAALCACGKLTERTANAPASATDPSSLQAAGSDVDQAFLQAMVPHHEMAIAMARMAEKKAVNASIRAMTGAIIRTQSAEIETMKTIHQRLFGSALIPDMMAHDRLGLSMEESGMTMNMRLLEKAPNFDRLFSEQMMKHHQGAINMSLKAIEKTSDGEIRKLAKAIIKAQLKEIDALGKNADIGHRAAGFAIL